MKASYFGAILIALPVGAAPAIAQTAAATGVAGTATSVAPAPTAVAPAALLAPSPPAAPITVAAAPQPDPNVLRMGTEVTLKMSETITTKGKKLLPGYLAHLEVMDPVVVNGIVVIPAGSPAVAEITDVRNKGMWGKSGKINARMLYVTVGDRRIRLRGVFDDKGVTGTAGVVAAIAFVPVAGFFTTGTSASLPIGAGVKGFVDEDVPLRVAAAPVPPLVLSAPAATASVFAPAPANAPVAATTTTQQPASTATVGVTQPAAAPSAVAAVPPATAPAVPAALTIIQAKRANSLYTSTGQNGSIYQVDAGPDGTVASVEFIFDGRIIRVPGSTLSAGTKSSRLNTSLTAKEVSKL